MKEFIEIPFGAKDSELGGWEYNIPEGYTASIENGKIIVKKEESEDEKIRKELLDFFDADSFDCGLETEWRNGIKYKDILAWLEKQDTKVSVYRDTLFKIATILSQYEDKDDSPLEKIRSIMIDGTICSMDLESKRKECGEQKFTDKEMQILLQTEYEKGKADAIEQKSAWSEEDIKAIDRACVALRAYSNGELPNFLPSELLGYADKLQSLIPQNRWKPSKEQMYYLSWIANVKLGDGVVEQEVSKHLNGLYDDLKKLMEK